MFICDFKDFRKFSTYPIDISEERLVEALIECGVSFDAGEPMNLRVRVKDMDPRCWHSQVDVVDEGVGCDVRLNIYMPPLFPPTDVIVEATNLSIRHDLTHVAQYRKNKTWPLTEDMAEELEAEAVSVAEKGSVAVLGPCHGAVNKPVVSEESA